MHIEVIEPFPYQVVGAVFLSKMSQALLGDDPGLGKSCQVVRAADLVGAMNILVFSPASVRVNWDREFTRFSPLDRPCSVLLSGKDAPATRGVTVCSYDLAANPAVLKKLMAMEWDALVLDECQYLKERSAKRTKAIYGHGRQVGLASKAKRIWRLSGTPAPNDASELWTHLHSAGIVQYDYYDFMYRFCTGFDSDYGFKITGHKNVDELKQLLARFMLRRKKEEVMTELPPITFQEVTVERSAVELDPVFYEQTRMKTTAQFHEDLKQTDQTLRNALKAISQSRTASTDDKLRVLEGMAGSVVTLRRYIGMAKLPKVCETIADELDMDLIDKIVIFAVHRDVIEHARQRLARFGAVTLYGGTDAKLRQRNIDKFQKDKKTRVFIGNVVAAGTGITLTAAHEVAFIEADWVPANNAQAAMRCHRIGQTEPVRVRFFSCAGSVDEEVMHTLARKTRELSKIF